MTEEPSEGDAMPGSEPPVSFQTRPDLYHHWRLEFDGDVARLVLDVDEQGGLRPGYELKLNSYDLGVDIELYDAVQRLRFEHPEVRAVVITSGDDKVFCAGANIRMLAGAGHAWKVNFCKFTNETRCGIEDASEHSGQTYLAAVNGTASGGGYEIALACDRILLIDDRSAAVSLPEVPLLGVLPGTGGLTRVVDKRKVRRDRADVFATRPEGLKGRAAVEWRLVDEAIPRSRFAETVRERARQAAAESARTGENGTGVTLPLLEPRIAEDRISYRHVTADLETDRVTITVRGPEGEVPETVDADFWPLAMTRELDDLILWLRTNEPERGTWVVKTTGDADAVLAYEESMTGGKDWLTNEIRHYYKRTLKRLDVTSRSLVALVEPGSCFAGALLETALACDRQYLLEGAEIVVTDANFGAYPMANGLTRLASRFHGEDAPLRDVRGRRLGAGEAEELGLVTLALDDIDWEEEIRIALEERASLSPDALTGMEANHRFAGPETLESKIFGRLSAWQNWIFTRPGAAGPDGALSKYGTGKRASFDRKRV
ncbi:MAG: 2,3-epoxybenzoyl-CoA dihydrolase [Actinoallomurus sp.]